jgi:hypothetical protein
MGSKIEESLVEYKALDLVPNTAMKQNRDLREGKRERGQISEQASERDQHPTIPCWACP